MKEGNCRSDKAEAKGEFRFRFQRRYVHRFYTFPSFRTERQKQTTLNLLQGIRSCEMEWTFLIIYMFGHDRRRITLTVLLGSEREFIWKRKLNEVGHPGRWAPNLNKCSISSLSVKFQLTILDTLFLLLQCPRGSQPGCTRTCIITYVFAAANQKPKIYLCGISPILAFWQCNVIVCQ